ncbi:hypothetical protein [Solibacillus cecembensis]|uniref:hypothetical protein n=1 Tax=Solibacillus cecembensis TaxID=459347 RepID=UPI003CFD1567
MNEIPTADFLKELAKGGRTSYEQDVLNGPLLKRIISRIEDSALEGYTAWEKLLDSHDDIRALNVIRKELQEKGFKCEFKTRESCGLLGSYTNQFLIVNWGGDNK